MRLAAMAVAGLLVMMNAAQGREEAPDGLPVPPAHRTDYPVTIHGPTTEHVCAGTVRPGWVRVDEIADGSGKCSNGKAWLITKLDDVPNRQALAICKIKVVPMRWYQWRTVRDRNVCRDAATEGEDNVMIIRRGKDLDAAGG